MRITKQIAADVAKQLIVEKQSELTLQKKKLADLVTQAVIKTIPKSVLDIFEANKTYFQKTTSRRFAGNGFNFEYLSCSAELPTNGEYVTPDEKDSAEIINQKHHVDSLKTDLEKFRKEIEVALFNLHTYKNVEKQFPEAFKLLPMQQTSAIVVDIKNIRCKLDKANC